MMAIISIVRVERAPDLFLGHSPAEIFIMDFHSV